MSLHFWSENVNGGSLPMCRNARQIGLETRNSRGARLGAGHCEARARPGRPVKRSRSAGMTLGAKRIGRKGLDAAERRRIGPEFSMTVVPRCSREDVCL